MNERNDAWRLRESRLIVNLSPPFSARPGSVRSQRRRERTYRRPVEGTHLPRGHGVRDQPQYCVRFAIARYGGLPVDTRLQNQPTALAAASNTSSLPGRHRYRVDGPEQATATAQDKKNTTSPT